MCASERKTVWKELNQKQPPLRKRRTSQVAIVMARCDQVILGTLKGRRLCHQPSMLTINKARDDHATVKRQTRKFHSIAWRTSTISKTPSSSISSKTMRTTRTIRTMTGRDRIRKSLGKLKKSLTLSNSQYLMISRQAKVSTKLSKIAVSPID